MTDKKSISLMYRRLLLAAFIAILSVVETSCIDKHITREETVNNFEENSKQIMELADYFWKVKMDSNEVFFKPLKNRYTISIAHPNWAISPDKPYHAGRDMRLDSEEMSSFLKKLGWTTNTVRTLKNMLKKSNCLSISADGDHLQLEYGADDICSFSYFITEKPFSDSTIENDSKKGVTFLSKNVRIGMGCAL